MRGRLMTVAVAILLVAGWVSAAETAAPPAKAAPAPATPAPAAAQPVPSAPAAPTNDAQFFAELGYKDVATAADTARAMAIFVSEGKETTADFEACRTYLKTKGLLPDGWLSKVSADEPLDKNRLAVLLCKALRVKGGMWMRLLGPQPRLAMRECVYLELIADGAEYVHVTGGELVGAIDRADRHRAAESGPKTPESPKAVAEEKK